MKNQTKELLTNKEENLQTMYLDYVNNFLTVSRFAEHYNITEERANEVIETGETAHAKYLFNKNL